MELRVLLGERDVGVIRSQRDGRNEFVFSSDYLTAGERPVLGQYFEDHLDAVHRSQTQLPAFFSNLLPEGGLRELIARRAGVHRDRELPLIAYDLVSTVTYIPDDKLGLKLSRENRFHEFRLSHFERLADKVGISSDRVIRVVRDTIQRAMATWPTADTRDPLRTAALRAHVERLPLLAEVG